MMKHRLLTPGPTQVPPVVASVEGLPVIHHRTNEFMAVYGRIAENLQYLFQTGNNVLTFASSGTGAMEAAVANFVSPKDKAIVLSTGHFGERWITILEAYGAVVVPVRASWGKAADMDELKGALREHADTKAVYATFTETSTGVVNDIKTLCSLVSKTKAVSVIDAISGIGGQELKTDAWGIDVVVAGSQKGIMIPPGLAFISISKKALPLIDRVRQPRFYFDLRKAVKSHGSKQTPFTPAVSLIVALNKALELIKADGLENLWKQYAQYARATQAGFKALNLKLFAKKPCNVLTAALVPEGIDGAQLVKFIREEYGISLAGGQAQLKGKIIRLAHMGYVDQFDVCTGITAVEMALQKMGYAVTPGAGVGAAQKELLS